MSGRRPPRRVLIVGGGAIGGLLAGCLASHGSAEVAVYDLDPRTVAALAAHGARVSGLQMLSAPVQAATDPAELGPCDVAFMAVKGHATAAASAAVAPLVGTAPVVSLQNGFGNEEAIAAHLPTVVRGVTLLSAHTVEPGHVAWDAPGRVWIGPFEPTGTSPATVVAVGELLRDAGFDVEVCADARPAQWSKLIFNLTNAVGALSLLPHGEIARFPPTRALIEQLVAEGIAVARAHGVEPSGDPLAMIDAAAEKAPEHKASTLQDVLARRRTEVDALNGALVELGREAGVPTPANAAVWGLVRGLERSWERQNA